MPSSDTRQDITNGEASKWPSASGSRRHILFTLLLFTLLTVLFSALVVKDLRRPLFGRGDFDQWPYQGYYVATHLQFTPVPQLDFHNDDVFYPYGVSNVFRPWNFESAYVYASLYNTFGHGPWLQWYYLVSVFACALIVYLVVGWESGSSRCALAAGTVLAFANFPAISRFPDHFGYATVHWMTLSILLDFVIVRRLVRRQPVSLQLLLLKAAAQTLCLGHDLGYICGVSLTSTTLSVTWVAVLAMLGNRLSGMKWRRQHRRLWQDLRTSAAKRRPVTLALATMLAVACFLYVPLAWQVFLEARPYTGTSMPGLREPIQQWNLVRPILPSLVSVTGSHFFTTDPFYLRPGLALVLGGLMGLVLGWRYRLGWVVATPFLVLLATMLFFNSACFRWAMHLPWWSMATDADRFGVFIPIALVCFVSLAPRHAWSSRRVRTAIVLVAGLFVTEWATTYAYLARHSREVDVFDEEVLRFTEIVSRTPGEAVLDWPFRIQAGNDVGVGDRFNAYHSALIHGPFLQAFHHKKSVGGYFGRLHPDQIEPFREAGWQWLFLPDSLKPSLRSPRQHRNFTSQQWDFLTEFFRGNDFCGIILYTRLLPPETVQEFHHRFGEPMVTANIPRAGRAEFIPKREDWRGRTVDAMDVAPRFRPPVLPAGQPGASFRGSDGEGLLIAGWSPAKPTGRWSRGPVAELAFSLPEPTESAIVLDLELHAFRGQRFEVFFNGPLVRTGTSPKDRMTHYRIDIPARFVKQSNLVRIEIPDSSDAMLKGAPNRFQRGIQLRSLTWDYRP